MDQDPFLHGGDHKTFTDTPRTTLCATCAFKPGSPVRPPDFDTSGTRRL